MFHWIYLFYQLFSNVIIIGLLQYSLSQIFTPRKFANRFTNYILPGLFFWLIYYTPNLMQGMTLEDVIPYYYYFTTSMVVSFAWAYIFLAGDPWGKLSYLIYYYSTYKCFKFIFGGLYEVKNLINTTLYQILDLLSFFIVLAGMIFLTRMIIRHPLRFIKNMTLAQKGMLLLCPSSFFIILQLADPSIHVPYQIFITIAAILLLVNIPIIYYIYVTVGDQYESQMTLGRAIAETSSQLRRFRYTSFMEEQTRKERHELKNTYFFIQTLLHEQKYEQIDSYLADHIGALDAGTDDAAGLQTNNTLIDHILNTKIAEARKKHIKTYTEVVIPSELAINEDYFCTILLNLLDNAIEASVREHDPDLQVIMNMRNNNLVCCVKNKVSTNVFADNPDLDTTKEDKRHHGLGMKIIQDRVKKAGAIFSTTVEGSYFVATVILPVDQRK